MNLEWKLDQQNLIGFVMVDTSGNEVENLEGSLSGVISKNGADGAAMAGTFSEIVGMTGHYTYLSTAEEADTVGIVNIEITALGAVQQNLEYVIKQRTPGAVSYTYTVTSSLDSSPLEGVEIWITTDSSGNNVVWYGVTDASGIARDEAGDLPLLDPGSYYFWKQLSGYTDDQASGDLEVVS